GSSACCCVTCRFFQATAAGLHVLLMNVNAPWQMPMCSPTLASLKPVMFNVYQRAALVAHLKQQRDQAIAMCHSANKYDDSSRKHLGAETRMDRMIAVVEGAREALTP